MKKYYDMPNSKLVAMLDWKNGYGTLEQAKEHLSDKDVREISKKEFNLLGEKYSNPKKQTSEQYKEQMGFAEITKRKEGEFNGNRKGN